jgi:hypothetical protein
LLINGKGEIVRQRLQMRGQRKHQDGFGTYESLVHQSSVLPIRKSHNGAPQTGKRASLKKLSDFLDRALPSSYFCPEAVVNLTQEPDGKHCLPGEKSVPTSARGWHVRRHYPTARTPLSKLVACYSGKPGRIGGLDQLHL